MANVEDAWSHPQTANVGSGRRRYRPTPEDRRFDGFAGRRYLNPSMLAYLMGPLALVAILLLMRFDYITHESAWLWLAVFIAVPTATSSSTASTTSDRTPSRSTSGWPPRWRP